MTHSYHPDLTDRAWFFLHIPKTGGLSLRAYLSKFFRKAEICPPNSLQNLLKYTDEELAQFRFIRGHLPYNTQLLLPRMPVRITFLRNPLERTLSNHAYLKTRPDIGLHQQATQLALMDYLKDLRVRHNQSDIMTYYLSACFPIRGRRNRRKNLDLALRRLETFEFVGITERYTESMELLAYTLGIPPAEDIPRRNVSEQRLRAGDLSPAEHAEIDMMTRQDQVLYAHACELFDIRYRAMKAKIADESAETSRQPN